MSLTVKSGEAIRVDGVELEIRSADGLPVTMVLADDGVDVEVVDHDFEDDWGGYEDPLDIEIL